MEATYFGQVELEENNGFGPFEPCITHSENGNIPGRCMFRRSWYTFGGEKTSSDFDPIRGSNSCPIRLVLNVGSGLAPPGTIAGTQKNQPQPIYAAIASTEWGPIPGKAMGNTCWFAYIDKEYSTSRFFWITRVQGMEEQN